MMRISALSGMRIEEVGGLKVEDCSGDAFNIRKSKTEAGVRRVPIHTALRPLIARRTSGKRPDAFLIEELKPRASGNSERTAKASERFTAYRRTLGIEEKGHETSGSRTWISTRSDGGSSRRRNTRASPKRGWRASWATASRA
jgi:integrase